MFYYRIYCLLPEHCSVLVARPCQELQLTIEWVTRSIAIELLTTNCAPPGTEFYNQKLSVLFNIYI